MKVVIPIEARLLRSPDGRHWVRSPSNYVFWARYLRVFDGVRLLARVRAVPEVPVEHNRVDGPGVAVTQLPYFVGPAGFVHNFRAFRKSIRSGLGSQDAVMLRMPGHASATALSLLARSRPYGVEVVGDPSAVFSAGASSHPLRPILRILFTRQMRRATLRASGVSYVSLRTLPSRYPSRIGAYKTNYSSAELPETAFASARTVHKKGQIRCVTVGSLETYKGFDTAIEAIAICRANGLEATLTVVGDGRLRRDLEQLAADRGLATSVHFTGQLKAGAAVRRRLDAADVFVLASKTEGLPRAMIEAMARGLPALGSRVGGIPELLSRDCMFAPGDHVSLSRRIEEVAGDETRYMRLSASSLEKAREYRAEVLEARRDDFYTFIRKQTEGWGGP